MQQRNFCLDEDTALELGLLLCQDPAGKYFVEIGPTDRPATAYGAQPFMIDGRPGYWFQLKDLYYVLEIGHNQEAYWSVNSQKAALDPGRTMTLLCDH